jgi:hypothetical protein
MMFVELAFGGGVRALEAAGFKLGDDLVDPRACEHYRNGLHRSFAQAQNEIGQIVLELERKRLGLERRLRVMREERDSLEDDLEGELAAVSNRIMVLRRLIDAILYVALSPDTWKRLAISRGVPNPEPKELEAMLTLAEGLNRLDPRQLFLVCDLTSVAQLGDMLRIRWDESGAYLALMELKKRGVINDALADRLERNAGKLSEEDLAEIASEFGERAVKQAERMKRQWARFEEFTLRAEPNWGQQSNDPEIRRLSQIRAPAMATYLHLLPEVIASAKAHDVAFHCIDDCLWLIGMSEAGIEQVGDSQNLHHILFHAKYPERSCNESEVEALNRQSPLVNLAAHNLTHVHSRPPLAWPREIVADIIMDRVRIYAQFDLQKFFECSKIAGLRLSLITGREAEEGKKNKLSGPMLEEPKAYGVKVELPDGRTLRLVSSFFRSVYSDLVRPSGILSVIAAMR